MLTESERTKTIEWLSRANNLYYDIRLIKKEIDLLEARKFSIGGASGEAVQKSPSGDAAYAELINMIDDRERELKDRRICELQTVIEISKMIDRIDDMKIVHALKWRYIFNANITQTAEEIKYSESQTKRLINLGVAKIFELIKNELK